MTFRGLCCAIVAGAALVVASSAHAQTTIQLNPSKDNSLYESQDPLSNGAGSRLFAGRTLQGADEIRRALLAFDIASAVPAGSTITGATLTLTVVQVIDSEARDHTLHRVQQDWGEAGSVAPRGQGGGAPAEDGDATWRDAIHPGTPWTNAGGDFDSAALATASVDGLGPASWASPDLTSQIQDWLDNPGTNFGLLVLGDETVSGSARAFGSREGGASAPILEITYIPAPGVASLALLASPWALRRRRT